MFQIRGRRRKGENTEMKHSIGEVRIAGSGGGGGGGGGLGGNLLTSFIALRETVSCSFLDGLFYS